MSHITYTGNVQPAVWLSFKSDKVSGAHSSANGNFLYEIENESTFEFTISATTAMNCVYQLFMICIMFVGCTDIKGEKKESVMEQKKTTSTSDSYSPAMILAYVDSVISLEPGSQATLPIPLRWPPKGAPELAYYIYRRGSPASTGRVMYKMSSPTHKVIYTPASDEKYKIINIDFHPLSPLEPKSYSQPDPIVQNNMIADIIAAMEAEKVPAGQEAQLIRDTYRLWLSVHPALQQFLKTEHKEFIDWIVQP